ncbi:MAG: hypothetical protein MHM6MM_001734 [Cercozoa sp. M6MM]
MSLDQCQCFFEVYIEDIVAATDDISLSTLQFRWQMESLPSFNIAIPADSAVDGVIFQCNRGKTIELEAASSDFCSLLAEEPLLVRAIDQFGDTVAAAQVNVAPLEVHFLSSEDDRESSDFARSEFPLFDSIDDAPLMQVFALVRASCVENAQSDELASQESDTQNQLLKTASVESDSDHENELKTAENEKIEESTPISRSAAVGDLTLQAAFPQNADAPSVIDASARTLPPVEQESVISRLTPVSEGPSVSEAGARPRRVLSIDTAIQCVMPESRATQTDVTNAADSMPVDVSVQKEDARSVVSSSVSSCHTSCSCVDSNVCPVHGIVGSERRRHVPQSARKKSIYVKLYEQWKEKHEAQTRSRTRNRQNRKQRPSTRSGTPASSFRNGKSSSFLVQRETNQLLRAVLSALTGEQPRFSGSAMSSPLHKSTINPRRRAQLERLNSRRSLTDTHIPGDTKRTKREAESSVSCGALQLHMHHFVHGTRASSISQLTEASRKSAKLTPSGSTASNDEHHTTRSQEIARTRAVYLDNKQTVTAGQAPEVEVPVISLAPQPSLKLTMRTKRTAQATPSVSKPAVSATKQTPTNTNTSIRKSTEIESNGSTSDEFGGVTVPMPTSEFSHLDLDLDSNEHECRTATSQLLAASGTSVKSQAAKPQPAPSLPSSGTVSILLSSSASSSGVSIVQGEYSEDFE